MGELAQLGQPAADVRAQLVDQRWPRPRGSSAELALEQPELEVHEDEVLLRPVVEVALDLAPRGVGGRDDPRAGLTQVVGHAPQVGGHGVERVRELAQLVGGQHRDSRVEVAIGHAPRRGDEVVDRADERERRQREQRGAQGQQDRGPHGDDQRKPADRIVADQLPRRHRESVISSAE